MLVGYVLLAAPLGRAPSDDATSHRSFADVEQWVAVFDDPARDAYQKPREVVRALRIRPGMRVADVGAGTGYFSRYRSAAVGAAGTVLAVDTEPELVRYLRERAEKEKTDNVVPILASPDNPRLPRGAVDLVLLVDTFHHIDHRVAYFGSLRRTLAPGGRVAVVDWQKRETPVGPEPEHRLAREQVVEERRAAAARGGGPPAPSAPAAAGRRPPISVAARAGRRRATGARAGARRSARRTRPRCRRGRAPRAAGRRSRGRGCRAPAAPAGRPPGSRPRARSAGRWDRSPPSAARARSGGAGSFRCRTTLRESRARDGAPSGAPADARRNRAREPGRGSGSRRAVMHGCAWVASRPDPRYRSEARTEHKEPSMSIAMKPPRVTVAGAAAVPHPLAGATMNGADMIV